MENRCYNRLLKTVGFCFILVAIPCLLLVINSTKTGYRSMPFSSVASFRFGEDASGAEASGSRTMTCNEFGDNKICQYGTVRSGHKYAIYGSTLFDQPRSENYCFLLPLSAMAWNRIGYDSLIYIIGDHERCDNTSRIRFIVDALMAEDYVVLLVIEGIRQNNSVTLGQVLRLFGASFVQKVDDPKTWQDTYIITADADIWPVNETFFDLPPGKDILHGDISGNPEPDVNTPTNAPLSFVGMRVKTWIEVMSYFGLFAMPRTSKQLILYFDSVFGKSSCEGVLHGGQGWFIDQGMISRRIQEWKIEKENGTKKIYIYNRMFMTDRIDRVRWHIDILEGIVDAHILEYAYTPETWHFMRPLIKLLYPNNVTISWCDDFADKMYQLNITCRSGIDNEIY
ncbi:hypothetical protein LSH36_347g03009 [Paralvinella palmiformis]|uniref:Uncharacterized protein n=1 Tax=Paralvinella palmiformis TaxID=53620 RepID=A0AAD9JGB2_9ANNE|nr:hypothetical protein LSH36_347g03009 [Paralvinella palmiformis]